MKTIRPQPPGAPQQPGDDELPAGKVEVRLPVGTILRVLATLLLVWALLRLLPQLALFFVSVLLAVSLYPVVAYFEQRNKPRWIGVALVGLAMCLTTGFLFGVVLPPLMDEIRTFHQNLPYLQRNVERQIGPDHPFLANVLEQVLALPTSPELARWMRHPLAWGRLAVEVVTGVLLVLVMTIYLLLDGKRLYAWLLAYVPRRHRQRMAQTVPEVSRVVHAYVQGQVLTSFLCAVFSYVVLRAFRVPAALPLALFAGFADIVPVVGLVVSTVAMVLVALTVSPLAAVSVLVLFLLYNAVETYVILPRVYGTRMRLSTLAVLLALLVGATLGGIPGAILILPLVAAYPIVERIWLHEYLSDEVLADHTALEQAAKHGSDEAVDAVLRGERHRGERSAQRLREGG